MSSPEHEVTGFRWGALFTRLMGVGIVLSGVVFGIVLIQLLMSGPVRAGAEIPAYLIAVGVPGLLVVLGVWILARPGCLGFILAGVLLLLFGGFFLTALASGSPQPSYTLPAGLWLVGLAFVCFVASIAMTRPLTPPAATTRPGTEAETAREPE